MFAASEITINDVGELPEGVCDVIDEASLTTTAKQIDDLGLGKVVPDIM